VCSKSIPAVMDICRPHSANCRMSLFLGRKCYAQRHVGLLNPEGQRSFAIASAHFSSVPKSFRNIVMLIPFWNWTRYLFAMDCPEELVP